MNPALSSRMYPARQTRSTAVSYTHLDVYKRQIGVRIKSGNRYRNLKYIAIEDNTASCRLPGSNMGLLIQNLPHVRRLPVRFRAIMIVEGFCK